MRVALWIKARIGKTISYIPRLRPGKRSFILEVQTPPFLSEIKRKVELICFALTNQFSGKRLFP